MRELSLNVLDIVQNSISAGARLISIDIIEDIATDTLTIKITDNGKGMTAEQVSKITDPFYTTRTTRRVGLGVPLLKMAAEMSGGHLSIESCVGKGTTLCAVFGYSNIDRMPLGDINGTLVTLISMNPELDFVYHRQKDNQDFTLDTRQLKAELGDVPLSAPEVIEWIKEYLTDGDQTLN